MRTALEADGTRRLSLDREQFFSLSLKLKAFYQKSRCAAVILCDASGLVVASAGSMQSQSFPVIAALAAGNYAATAELSRLIGEDGGFRVHFHEGHKNSLYLAEVFDDYFLVVVFGTQSSFGMVRVLTAAMIPELTEILSKKPAAEAASQSAVGISAPEEFREELASRLSGLFSKGTKRDG